MYVYYLPKQVFFSLYVLFFPPQQREERLHDEPNYYRTTVYRRPLSSAETSWNKGIGKIWEREMEERDRRLRYYLMLQ